MLKNKKLIIAISIVPQFLLIKLLANYPEFVEAFYSQGIYPIISKTLRYALGWLPFSFGDIIYTIGGLYALRWLYKNRKRITKDTKNWLIDVLTSISLIYFAFHVFWGLNYYRIPLHQSIELDHKYSTEELVSVTKKLIEKSNTIHSNISETDSNKVIMPYSKKELIAMSPNGYVNLEKQYPQLEHHPKSTKRSIYSLPLTYMGFSGYLNPFTNEAQIDGLIPLFKYPTTICHEQAHQLGYAAENETNFIGCLAAIHNDDIYYKFSGYIFALRHCLNELYRRDEVVYEELLTNINKGILANYQEAYDFWMSYQNPLEPIFKDTFDTFLKANNQEKGIESYSYAVALMVNYFKDKDL